MSRLNTPLSDAELDRLDTFLLERIPDEEPPGKVDEGILDISALDGFLTAIISGPRVIPPAEWLPVVWGGFEPRWQSPAEAEAMVSLLLRHMSGIVDTLQQRPEKYEPIILEREEEAGRVTVVDEWCAGYMKGLALAARQWRDGGERVMELMVPITLFSSEEGRKQLTLLAPEEVEVLKRAIPAAVQKIHAFWQGQRRATAALPSFMHDTPPPGRNDPCPCGSGKKFKKCCLH
ncbi:MAG: UPF0149 family protein [Gammaproteobacteria bacterium]|nr:UPF0149 family protein [Gammaproteobacteria bacterium]